MVKFSALNFRLLFRLLGHRIKTGRLLEVRQLLANGSSAQVSRARLFGLPTNSVSSEHPPLLFQMATAYWVSQLIYTAAKLGIADELNGGPKSAGEIATVVDADEDSLHRILRALCVVNVCQITKSQKFKLMPLGQTLRSGVPGSLRSMILTLGEIHYKTWGYLCQTVQTGRPSFRSVFGSEMFDFLEGNSSAGETFNLAMTDYSALVAHAVLLAYDFAGIKSLIDVGGGCGKLLTSILEVYPSLQGVVVDLPGVINGANEHMQPCNCRGRFAAVAGNFLESLPRGGDLYLLSGVIHDWNNQNAQIILSNCRSAMRPQGKVLLVECVVPERDNPSFSKLLDLNMMVMTGGRERTEREFRELFGNSGLRVTRVIPTLSPLRIIEAVCN